jgi:hypothetical protein
MFEMVLIVSYDLHAPGRDYEGIAELLKSARSWAHPQGSVWFLDTSRDAAWWRDELKKCGDSNDEYFVARLHQNWAGFNTDGDVVAWLKSSARTW